MSKFIVNNKVYDTEKAEVIATGNRKWEEYSWIFGRNIYPSRDTTLYKTSKGAFFFVGKCDYDTLKIEVVTEDRAKDWLKYSDYDKYVELYGELEEA